jgi:hypothetical protein
MRLRWSDAPVGGTRAVKVSGGAKEAEEFDQTRRRVRLTGVDEEGQSWGAQLWLPSGGKGYGGDRRTGDAALLGNLETRDPRDDCAALGAYQRLLTRHYANVGK